MAARNTSLPLVSALALAASAGLASAADMPAEAPVLYSEVPAANWSGFYAGSLIGYGWTDAEVTTLGATGSDTVDGATGGGVIGYNWQSGNFVFGVEGDITLHEIRGEVDSGTVVDVDTLYSTHLRGRIGYDMGRFLPYIAGGFTANETYARLDGTELSGDNEWMYGWNIGAGVDVRLGDTFIGPVAIRAEYLYEDVGSETFDLSGTAAEVEHGTHFVRLGLISYLAGDSDVPAGAEVDWSGAYGGLLVGYSRHDIDSTLAGGGDLSQEADGALGGIYTGRNFQFGRLVAGFEGGLYLTNIEDTVDLGGGDSFDYRANIQGEARVRVGYAFGNFLPFIAGGALWTRSEQELDIAGVDQQSGRNPTIAWTVGGGLDYRISDRLSVRGEYLYGRDSDTVSSVFDPVLADQETEFHQVRFGTAYHF